MKYEYAGVSGFSAPFHRRGKEGADMEEQNRKKITLWIRPDILSRMDGWLESDNCKSRGEFTEKALRFYMGHLSSEDTSEYLSKALVSTGAGSKRTTKTGCEVLFSNCAWRLVWPSTQ